MLQLASWIRECDQAHFRRFFGGHPDILVRDARLEPVDPETADGLLITGGPDISAEFLDQEPVDVSLIGDPEPVRAAWEFAAIRSAYARGVARLFSCKGAQALNGAL